MARKSQEKGQRGAREVRDLCKSNGFEAHCVEQGSGGGDKEPDVVNNIPDIHIEVKRVEAFSCVTRAIEQAKKDAGTKIPTVWSRTNRAEWLVTLPASAFFTYLKGNK